MFALLSVDFFSFKIRACVEKLWMKTFTKKVTQIENYAILLWWSPYMNYITIKKYKLFVTCDMSNSCYMSHFKKIEKSVMTCGFKNSYFGFIFEARTKSP